MTDDDPSGEYTRYRANIQLGDGPDKRGDITVETVREVREDRQMAETSFADPVTPEQGRTVITPQNGVEFGEFWIELSRATQALRDSLRLKEDPEDGN